MRHLLAEVAFFYKNLLCVIDATFPALLIGFALARVLTSQLRFN